MHFASDNWAGAHEAIAENAVRRNQGFAAPYGKSDLDRTIETTFNDLFETEVDVFFFVTGTAANSLALTCANRPGGVVFCHSEAHIRVDECSAPEFFTGGAKLESIEGPLGRLTPDSLASAIAHVRGGGLNAGQPMAASVTQVTESGTLYTPEEVAAIAAVTHDAGISLHMDGARFANAIAAIGCTPAEMTWKSGIDMLTFGGTKNGCWCAEALVIFRRDLAAQVQYLRKRAGHTLSKSRFMAAQFEAYLHDDLWITLGRHANAMAADLAGVIGADDRHHLRLAWEPQANEVFAIGTAAAVEALIDAGVSLNRWQAPRAERHLVGDGEQMVRLVTSFATQTSDVADFAKALARL